MVNAYWPKTAVYESNARDWLTFAHKISKFLAHSAKSRTIAGAVCRTFALSWNDRRDQSWARCGDRFGQRGVERFGGHRFDGRHAEAL